VKVEQGWDMMEGGGGGEDAVCRAEEVQDGSVEGGDPTVIRVLMGDWGRRVKQRLGGVVSGGLWKARLICLQMVVLKSVRATKFENRGDRGLRASVVGSVHGAMIPTEARGSSARPLRPGPPPIFQPSPSQGQRVP
jgi:hypothetical protein